MESDLPPRHAFTYTFENLAQAIDRFTDIIGLKRFALYVFDYGAPVGLRIAAKPPERITAIISQNGNAYEEGLSQGWNPIRTYWREPTRQTAMPYAVSYRQRRHFFSIPTGSQSVGRVS